MPAQAAKMLTGEDWLVHKPVLRKLWLDDHNRKLEGKDGVIEFMKTKHNFSAT